MQSILADDAGEGEAAEIRIARNPWHVGHFMVVISFQWAALVQQRILNTPLSHLTEEKISHLANGEIPHMADASGGFLLYTGVKQRDRRLVYEVG
jgi:hypothetical protein